MQVKRFESVDFWRGLALVAIFVNHMPGNVLEAATPRNFGFSDSAEAFVFMAGFAGALAYGGKMERGETRMALLGITRRVSQIYIIQVFLTFLAMSLYSAAYMWGGAADILAVHNRAVFLLQPLESLVGVFLVSNQIGYYNILPMYILFLACSPVLLWLANRSGLVLIAASIAVYGLARVTGLNLPTFPQGGTWFFNPFCWQLVYCLGVAFGTIARKGGRVNFPHWFYYCAIAICIASAFIVSNGLGALPDLFSTVTRYLDLSKTDLGGARLASFLSLVYVIHVSSLATRFKTTPIYRPVSVMGRNSLWVFAAGSILATIGQIMMATLPRFVALDVSYAVFGVVVLYLVAILAQAARETAPQNAQGPIGQPALR